MAALEKTVSALIDRQLPDFVRADHPQFKRFLEVYYEWLEDETKGNTVYHIMNSEKYRDVDETLDPFIRLFKEELLPYFPETTELDLVKILKGAREFYAKKGSIESVKWLFHVLFNKEIEVYYPKQQILIASDGKWKLPQAFQLTLSANNANIDVNLLEKHKGTGSISKATCIIESANKTVDRTFGNEILEMYVSNVNKSFTSGENLEIPYTDTNDVEQLFVEKIIGSISSIKIDSDIISDPQQKRRGLLYNVGDPVVVFGGLSDSVEANDAVAIVGNVTVGSVEGLSVTFPGYGYRLYSNTEVIVYRHPGDDPNANLSTDIRVGGLNEVDSTTNSQVKFLEAIYADKMPIEYLANTLISDPDYAVFTGNNHNAVVTANNDGDPWYLNEHVYANGASFQTANFTARILTANTGWAGGPANLILYNIANTLPLTTAGFLIGVDKLISTNSGSVFNVSAVVVQVLLANSSSQIQQAITFEYIPTGGVALYNILNGGYGFQSTPDIQTESYYNTFWSENYAYGTAQHTAYRQLLSSTGQIAHIYINNPGAGYVNGEAVVVTGRGYSFSGNVVVGANGAIKSVNILNRGEGYYGDSTVSVTTGAGTNAAMTAYGFGEGVTIGIETGAIGRIKDVRMLSRGFDYIAAPTVSFKIVDMVINDILLVENLIEGERVYQGATLETATFQGIVKDFNRSTGTLRLFNFSGAAFDNFNASLPFTSEGAVVFTIDLTARVTPPASYPTEVQVSGLPNPYWYGNGKARGYAEFFNGLIKFAGFYINTDGFLSADKKMQDSNTYHNYSYVIESEKNLRDYSNIVKDIVHPIGMSMLGRTITKSELTDGIASNSIIQFIGAIPGGSVVNVQNSWANTVNGINTLFANVSYANVGDRLWIKDSDNPLRSQIKTIRNIHSNTSLNVESDFVYVGQGKLHTHNLISHYATVSGNVNLVSDFIQTGDTIRANVNGPYMNSHNTKVDYLATGISGNVITTDVRLGTLVINGGFEAGTNVGWRKPPEGSIVTGNTHSGTYSLRLGSAAGGPDYWSNLIPVVANSVYNAEAWFKRDEGALPDAVLLLMILNYYANGTYINTTTLNTRSHTIAGWQFANGEYTVTSNVGYISLAVGESNGTTGYWFVDDISLVPKQIGDVVHPGNTNIVYLVVPDYKTTNYDYDIIRVEE
jgi:hypothetical protein